MVGGQGAYIPGEELCLRTTARGVCRQVISKNGDYKNVKLGLEDFVRDVVINCLGKSKKKNSNASSTNLPETFFKNDFLNIVLSPHSIWSVFQHCTYCIWQKNCEPRDQ